MRHHHVTTDVVSRLIDDALDPHARASAERHLETCASCQATWDALSRVKTTLQALPAVEERVGAAVPPLPVVVPTPSWGFPAGLAVGAAVSALVAVTVALPAASPPVKVVSPSPHHVVNSDGILDTDVVNPGTIVQTLRQERVDLEMPGHLLLRLTPGTAVTWQQGHRSWFDRRPKVIVNLMRGEILARTTGQFWGSRLEIRTPSATALVKGTAFAIGVDPARESTTVKVLAGSVFLSPHLSHVGVNVDAGQIGEIRAQHPPTPPTTVSRRERELLFETYRIGRDPLVAVVIGSGPERLKELLRPAPLYLSDRQHPALHGPLRRAVQALNTAILDEADRLPGSALRVLTVSLDGIEDRGLAVPLRLFAGACALRHGDTTAARWQFHEIVARYPKDPLASLALAAIGQIADEVGDDALARETFRRLKTQHPNSPEATLARASLK